MIIEKLLTLPFTVKDQKNGLSFSLRILNEINDGINLVYLLNDVDAKSPHYEHFCQTGGWLNHYIEEDYSCDFLWLSTDINTDEELIYEVDRVHEFFRQNELT